MKAVYKVSSEYSTSVIDIPSPEKWSMESWRCILFNVLHHHVGRYQRPHGCAMHLLVDLASERQIANCNTEFEDEADVLCEARPIRQGRFIQQPLTGHLNGTRG